MAKIPQYGTRKVTPSGRAAGAAIPFSVADVGQGLEAQALGAIGRGVSDVGGMMHEIAMKTKSMNDNRDVASGVSQYNEIINKFNETLPTASPDDYMDRFNELDTNISKITDGMSKDAKESLQNKFVVWNESNRASTAALALKQKASLAKQEIPKQLSLFISNDQITEANDYIEGYGDTILSPEEVTQWKSNIQTMKAEHNTQLAINLAVDDMTPENIAAADTAIRETYKQEPEEVFRKLNTLRAKTGAKKTKQTEARKALVDTEASNVIATTFDGEAYDANVTPENQQLVTQINSRIANGTISDSDGITYNYMAQQVNAGKFFSQQEILEGLAGTEAGGMSQEETEELMKDNEGNEGLSIAMKDELASYSAEIGANYGELKGIARTKLTPKLHARIFGVLEEDKRKHMKEVKKLVKEGASPEVIENAMQANFIADSKKYIEHGFKRAFKYGINDFTDVVEDASSREEENKVILDLLKSGSIEGALVDNIEELFERFNQ